MDEIEFAEYLENLLGKRGKKELLGALKQKKAIVISGKTTLAVILRERGYNVFESGVHLDKPLTECIPYLALNFSEGIICFLDLFE